MFGETYDKTLRLATFTFALLANIGLKVHPTKGHFLPVLVGEHFGMILNFDKGIFRASTAKLKSIAVLAKTLLRRAASQKRWVSGNPLPPLRKRHGFYIRPSQWLVFFLRELHDAVKMAKTCSGTVKLFCQIKRDLEWWTKIPSRHNGDPI